MRPPRDPYPLRSRLTRAQLLFSLLCSWVAAQVGAVQMRVADSLQVLCGAGLASTGIILVIVMGWHDVAQHPALKEALEASYGDWLRAILVSFLALPYAIFLPLRCAYVCMCAPRDALTR